MTNVYTTQGSGTSNSGNSVTFSAAKETGPDKSFDASHTGTNSSGSTTISNTNDSNPP